MNKKMILDCVSKAQAFGVPVSDATGSAVKELENPHYTVVVTGEFQVGKSTLLNRVMLDTDILLKEGLGTPTTAISTKIVYSDTKELTVFYRDAQRPAKIYYANEVTEDLIKSLTTAEGETARLALAQEIKYIQIGLPVDALRTYSFFDTPGVNDPNVELIERTTAETLKEADLVVMVVDASKSLSQSELSYLSKSVFAAGMSRVLLLASYKPQVFRASEDRDAVLNSIRAQLQSIGREYVPVYAYTYDSSVEGNILRGPEQIMNELLGYLANNRDLARIDKLAYHLAVDIGTYVEELKATVEVSGKTDEEIKELNRKIEAIARNLDAQYNQAINDFASEYAPIIKSAESKLQKDLLDDLDRKSAINVFLQQFNANGESTDAIRSRIDSAVKSVAPVVQSKLVATVTEFKKQISDLMQRISDKASDASSAIAISTEFAPTVSGGWAGRINPKLVHILETVLAAICASDLVIGAIVFFLDKIPGIKKILPGHLLVSLAKSTVAKTFKESLTVTIQGVLDQMNMASETVKDGIRDLYAEIYREKIAPYKDAIKEHKGCVLDAPALGQIRDRIEALGTLKSEVYK